jgi:cell division protein FtsW (lipid II flippase)
VCSSCWRTDDPVRFAFGAILVALFSLIVFEPYRFERLMSFSNPWADPLGSGYQLVQCLDGIWAVVNGLESV